MAWQRKIPFGYRIEEGDIVPHPEEAEAVAYIYESYLQGNSYTTIASAMSELGIRYHDASTEWNKHMVKRILENPKYIGHSGYPVILPADIWNGTKEVRDQKTAGCARQPLCVEMVKRKFYCGECGSAISKDTYVGYGTRWWRCSNLECSVGFKMRDAALEEAVVALLNRLIISPDILDTRETAKQAVSLEAARIQNEINHELNKADLNEEYLITLILSCAAEKYAVLDDGAENRKIAVLKANLQKQPLLTAFDPTLFKDAVETVRVMANKTITLQIAGGIIIS